MYAVIQMGSSQYKVSEGDSIEVNRLESSKKKSIAVDKVLLYAKGSDIQIGQPYLKDVKVSAEIEKDTLGEKVVAFKYRRRKDSASKKGHRQKLTTLKITKITA